MKIIGHALDVKASFRQPASLISAVLMLNGPEARRNPDFMASIAPFADEEAVLKKGLPLGRPYPCFLGTQFDTAQGLCTLRDFNGTQDQVYKIYQHVFYEGLAASVYAGKVTPLRARELKKMVPDPKGPRPVPLLITTDKIFIPDTLLDHNDVDKKTGPLFDYYRQNWQDGMAWAAESLSQEALEDEDTRAILGELKGAAIDVLYPSFFFAVHKFLDMGANDPEYNGRHAWHIFSAEPYAIKYVATMHSEEDTCSALSLLEAGFLHDAVRADLALEALRDFNSLHYEIVGGEEATKCIDSISKSHVMDDVMRLYTLS